MGKKKAPPAPVTNTTTTTQPWSVQAPHLKNIFDVAYGQSLIPTQFYPNKTFAGFQPQELEALKRGEARAMAGSPSTKAATDYARGILSMDPKFLKASLAPRVAELLPGLQGQFNRAGMGNSSLARAAEQELINREAGRLRESAADRLERLGPQEYDDIARLAAVGETRRDMEQRAIDEAKMRHDFAQMEPSDRLARYLSMVMGNYGGSGTEYGVGARAAGGSRLSGALGGGMTGALAGGQFGGPLGALAGGIGGGLLGAFG